MIMLVFVSIFLGVTLVPTVVVLAFLNNKQQKELQQLRNQLQMYKSMENPMETGQLSIPQAQSQPTSMSQAYMQQTTPIPGQIFYKDGQYSMEQTPGVKDSSQTVNQPVSQVSDRPSPQPVPQAPVKSLIQPPVQPPDQQIIKNSDQNQVETSMLPKGEIPHRNAMNRPLPGQYPQEINATVQHSLNGIAYKEGYQYGNRNLNQYENPNLIQSGNQNLGQNLPQGGNQNLGHNGNQNITRYRNPDSNQYWNPQGNPGQQAFQPYGSGAVGGQIGDMHSRPPAQVIAKEIKQGFGVVNLTLIIGVLFILISGLIFATSTWDFIPDFLKMVLILSLSGLFFLAAFLAEKLFQLKHTSIAFYLLGCLFIPVVFISIGYFQLLGPWFSLDGDGRYFFCFLTAISFEGCILLGFVHYRLSFFKWTAWAASLGVLGFFIRIFTENQAVIWTVLNGYVLAVITWKLMKGKHQWLAYVHPLIYCMVLAAGFEAVLPDMADKGLVWAVFLSAAFIGYGMVRLPGDKRLRTYVSDYFLPFVMMMRGVVSLVNGNDVWSIGIFLIAAGCLLFITAGKEKKETDCLNAWLTCILLVLSLFPLWNICIRTGGWVYEAGIISYYTLFSAAGILIFYKRKALFTFAVLELPANALWGIAGIVQMLGCYALGMRCWILFWWVMTFCFLIQKRKQVYYVMAVIGLLLLPVLTVYSLKPGFSAIACWLITGCTAGLFYLYYLWRKKKENQTVWKCQMIRWIGVVGFYTSVILSLMLYLGERHWNAGYGVALFIFIIAGNWLGFQEKNTVPALALNLPLRSLAVVTLGKLAVIGRDQPLWAGLVVCIGMMCAGQLLYHRLYDIQPPKEHKAGQYYLDSFSFLACLIPFTMLIGFGNYWRFWGLVLLMVCLLNGYQRSEPFMDQWILTAVTAVGYVAFRLEPYVVIPRVWVTEYCLLLILLASLFIGFIWKEYNRTVGFIRYGTAVYAVLRQLFDCLFYTRLSDVLVLGIAMLLVLRLAYYWRKKRWLLLSASTLGLLAVYCSRDLWMNIAWWIYLLLAGIIMIIIAGFHEYSRKSGKDIRKKLKGSFAQWTW